LRPVIQTRKHIVQIALASITGVGSTTITLSQAIEGAHATSIQVSEGSQVRAVYVELWLAQSAANIGSFTGILFKNPGGSNAPSDANMAALHDWDNKKNILYTTQGITPNNTTLPMNFAKGWLKIPKGKQRQGLDDKIQISLRNNTTDDLNFCGFALYKELS